MTNSPHATASSGHDPRLLGQARDAVLPPLADAFIQALGRFDDALFDRAERAGPSQMAFLDAMRELRRRREEIIGRFRNALLEAWRSLEAGQPLSAEEILIRGDSSGLSLVTEQELESRLAARNLAAVLARDCKPVLSRLERRLSVLASVKLDGEHNPIGAEHIGAAIHTAFGTSDLALEVRLVVVKLCERELVPLVARIYEALDQRLVRVGVAPDLPAGPKPAPTPVPRPETFDSEPLIQDEEMHAPAWAARFVNRMAGFREMHGGSGGRAETEEGSYGQAPGTQTVLLEALHHLLQESRSQRGPESARGALGTRDLSQREMLSVLSLLQSTPSATLRAAIGDTGESLAQRLKNEVLSSATQLGVDPSTARLAPVDEDAIDLVGMLFDVMLDERDLEGRPRELIGRLVVPFVKVALLDRRMFVQKTHPARRLLNALAEACEGNNGESAAERTLLTKVEEVVDRLVAEFNENLAIFLTLEEEFRAFLDQHRRRIEIAERRAAEIQRGQERLETARTRMNAELSARVDGRELPGAIEEFLRQPWAHHVTMTLLREGEDSNALRDALTLADGILEELTEAQRQIIGKPWLQAWRPGLVQVFASVGMNADAAHGAVDALHDTLQAIAASRPDLQKSLPELPQVILPKPAEDENTPIQIVGGIDTLEFDHTDADHFRLLAIGTWLDFIDKDNKVQPGKLSWVSPISSRLLFVNRRGVRFCVASPEELAAMVRLGRLRRHIEEDAFDSAMQGVIDRLEPAARPGGTP
ncbi:MULTISPECIES: DUF1631 domain-containing protein [Pseudoxanthomonas]|jgi:Protein of unknown function (DUF1631)|uniref:DUF1631 domain-containing protein n=1 Tax=Pseudoxanthomonas TaxID=83618 RepID=UPI00160BE6B7|nr:MULTISPECIES: DUF1631 domain-containing protein [Pseudoxanthomonas]MBB3275337.1 hypothetical protein [Pseudoxanthomonas sp. OG2]MBV7473573.1 DUF1631 domain-containing protein [Pseudoxanthomonas sp. PXM05]UBB24274.1 DUF1631 domain-containing protein [Pseudoxanthomonas japonensis]